jgi:hypothetical protein
VSFGVVLHSLILRLERLLTTRPSFPRPSSG